MPSAQGLEEFNPNHIPWQFKVLKDVRINYDYSLGFHDILLSGTVGSAKSELGAHIGLTHCLDNPGAVLCLGRRAMPDLKDTIFSKILDQLVATPKLVEGRDYKVNQTRAQIFFKNKSKIISRSWGDRKEKKARSLDLSMLLIEELTENDEDDKASIDELKMRLGRVNGVKENLVIAMTNPDSPAHWAYKYYFDSKDPQRHVYLSKLDDNPFLPAWYKDQQLKDLDPKMARRMVGGEWIEIAGEVVYYAYDKAVNYRDTKYEINKSYPIRISFDFNIGDGKPLSAILYQMLGSGDAIERHFFDESVIFSARTEEALEDMAARGLFDHDCHYIIHGDATGKAKSTAAKHTNYEIINIFLSNYKRPDGKNISHSMEVRISNPPIRTRHNKVNAGFKNALGKHSSYIYADCRYADEGFRLTKLKKGGNYIEDDSKPYQHITTAVGYGIMSDTLFHERKPQGTVEL